MTITTEMTTSLYEYLLKLNQEVAKELIETYDMQKDKKKGIRQGSKETLLVFPYKRNEKIRVSEQELRFAMTNLHGKCNSLNLTYAVEAPTKEEYAFSGKSKRSGSTDLAFYVGTNKVLNIELKAHNPAQAVIDKDIEKLINEDTPGAWCHIFESEDRGTLKSVFNKLGIAIDAHKCDKKRDKLLYFSFLILSSRTLVTRIADSRLNSIFSLEYEDYYNLPKGKHIVDKGWQVDKF